MSVATITRERAVGASDELINAFLVLESLTNKLRKSESVAKYSVDQYEVLMESLVDEYGKKV